MAKSFALRAHCRHSAWRVFCAIELPEQVRLRVLQHIASLRAAVPEAKASWSRDESLHLTLKFLGNLPHASVANLSAAVARAVAPFASFTVRLEQTGVFPKHGPARVLWIGLNDQEGKLSALHARLEDATSDAGFPKEERAFHPHLTLARLRQPQQARRLAAVHKETLFDPIEIAVSELLVIRSELSRERSKYTVISRHTLGVSENV